MRTTILGSGTAIPDADRFPAGVLVESEGSVVLIDAGPGILRRLAAVRPLHASDPAARLGPEHLDAVLLTHFHTDHCADVAALLFALRNARYADRPPLRLAASTGLEAWLTALNDAWPWLRPTHPAAIETIELTPGDSLQIGDLVIDPVAVEHTDASLAYRARSRSSRAAVAISGDADECPGLERVARDVDLFVCEAAYPDAHRTPGHLTPRLAAAAAARAGAKSLCLTHFYPECEGHDLIAEARAAFDGPIHLARDLDTFDLHGTTPLHDT